MAGEGLDDVRVRIADFIRERDWERFHRPKDVAMALSIEASELMELYLWDRKPSREDLSDEIGDVLFFLVDLCMREGIDPVQAFMGKMDKNEAKYPAEKVKGKDLKYDRY
jgi:dCTP diphosphatase